MCILDYGSNGIGLFDNLVLGVLISWRTLVQYNVNVSVIYDSGRLSTLSPELWSGTFLVPYSVLVFFLQRTFICSGTVLVPYSPLVLGEYRAISWYCVSTVLCSGTVLVLHTVLVYTVLA